MNMDAPARCVFLLSLLLGTILLVPGYTHAQDLLAEMHPEELEGYQPPPMFGSVTESQIRIMEVPDAPQPPDLSELKPVSPLNAQDWKEESKSASSSAPSPVFKKAPVPQPRPAVLKVSRSYIQKARVEEMARWAQGVAADRASVKTVASSSGIKLGTTELMQPTAEDVLRSIEGKNYDVLQVASIEPAAGDTQEIHDSAPVMSMYYKSTTAGLPDKFKSSLLNNLLPLLDEEKEAEVKIEAYASLQEGSTESSRRRALSRALKLRDFFVENDINPDRIDVIARGYDPLQERPDRVDIYIGNP